MRVSKPRRDAHQRVFYHGRPRWTPSTEFADLFQCPEEFQPFLPHFRYALTDLTRYTDEEIRGIELLVAPLLAMRHIYDSDLLERIPDILRELARVIDTPAGLDTLMALLEYFASTNRFGWHELEAAAREAFPGPEGEEIMAVR